MATKEKRFRELILYIARESTGDPRFGRTKLNKLLFFADFLAYRTLGASISGEEYQKLQFGPAPRGFLPTVDKMIEAGECAWAEHDHFGRPAKRLVALRDPDVSVFSSKELHLVKQVIEEYWEKNAAEVTAESHNFVGWMVAEDRETIPYDMVFVEPPRPLTDEESEWAQGAIRRFRDGQPEEAATPA